ncbi:MAG: hypothetical protein E4G99_13635 [Anaerolineales bacterium]|nr:MAG: hypothetical protein E4G99_13635 [Anaerolineales bacterium]
MQSVLRQAPIRDFGQTRLYESSSGACVILGGRLVEGNFLVDRVSNGCKLDVAYSTDLDLAREGLIPAVQGVAGVLQDRPVEALLLEFGYSALIFRVREWRETAESTPQMVDRVNTAKYNALRREGIDVPFPSREVHHRFGSVLDPILVYKVRKRSARNRP